MSNPNETHAGPSRLANDNLFISFPRALASGKFIWKMLASPNDYRRGNSVSCIGSRYLWAFDYQSSRRYLDKVKWSTHKLLQCCYSVARSMLTNLGNTCRQRILDDQLQSAVLIENIRSVPPHVSIFGSRRGQAIPILTTTSKRGLT